MSGEAIHKIDNEDCYYFYDYYSKYTQEKERIPRELLGPTFTALNFKIPPSEENKYKQKRKQTPHMLSQEPFTLRLIAIRKNEYCWYLYHRQKSRKILNMTIGWLKCVKDWSRVTTRRRNIAP